MPFGQSNTRMASPDIHNSESAFPLLGCEFTVCTGSFDMLPELTLPLVQVVPLPRSSVICRTHRARHGGSTDVTDHAVVRVGYLPREFGGSCLAIVRRDLRACGQCAN